MRIKSFICVQHLQEKQASLASQIWKSLASLFGGARPPTSPACFSAYLPNPASPLSRFWQETTNYCQDTLSAYASADRCFCRAMNASLNGAAQREQRLTRLYMDLTGASESAARNVFMHVYPEENAPARLPPTELPFFSNAPAWEPWSPPVQASPRQSARRLEPLPQPQLSGL